MFHYLAMLHLLVYCFLVRIFPLFTLWDFVLFDFFLRVYVLRDFVLRGLYPAGIMFCGDYVRTSII